MDPTQRPPHGPPPPQPLAEGEAAAALAAALQAAQRGQRAEAIALLSGALRRAPADPALRAARARLHLRAGDRPAAAADARAAAAAVSGGPLAVRVAGLCIDAGALEAAEAVVGRLGPGAEARRAAARVWRALGVPELAHAAALSAARAAPGAAEELAAAAESAAGEGDPGAALELASVGLAASPAHRGLLRTAARARLERGDPGAEAAVAAWAAAAAGDPAEVEALGWAWAQLGRLPQLFALVQAHPGSAGGLRWAARLRLWALDLPGARAAAAELEAAGLGADAAGVRGALEVLEGRPAAALLPLARAAGGADPGEALCWRCEALIALDRGAEALATAQAAMATFPRYHLAARLLRNLAQLAEGSVGPTIGPASAEVAPKLRALLGPDVDVGEAGHLGGLRALGGNRSLAPTRCGAPGDPGGLLPWACPADPREDAHLAQLVLKVRGIDAAVAEAERVIARHGGHPLTRTYRGELELWRGAYSEAEAAFCAALEADPLTLWAWIGRGAVRLLQGDPAGCVALLDLGQQRCGFRGPTGWIYMGEALLALGRPAEDALLQGLKASPRRLSSWICLAELAAAEGAPGPAEALRATLLRLAPGLLPEGGPAVEALRAARQKMRGNRSSSLVTWWDGAGRLRLLPPPPGGWPGTPAGLWGRWSAWAPGP